MDAVAGPPDFLSILTGCFATPAAENPTVAMAIMIEGGGVGGKVAAPAAKPVLEAALAAQKSK